MARTSINGVQLDTQHLSPAQGLTPRETGIQAPTIVFLHEGLGSISLWRDWPQAVCDATGLPGLVYSRRGYGQSETVPNVRNEGRLPATYLHTEAWAVLPALLAQLNIHNPVLLGHSDGASIALLYAARFPTTACVVMAPHVMVEEISLTAIAQAREAFAHGPLRTSLARYHADVDCAFWQWNDVWLSGDFRNFDIRPECTNIRCPVLAIQGHDDPYGTMAQIELISTYDGRVKLQKLEHCGHSPHRDQTALTTRLIQAFLATLTE